MSAKKCIKCSCALYIDKKHTGELEGHYRQNRSRHEESHLCHSAGQKQENESCIEHQRSQGHTTSQIYLLQLKQHSDQFKVKPVLSCVLCPVLCAVVEPIGAMKEQSICCSPAMHWLLWTASAVGPQREGARRRRSLGWEQWWSLEAEVPSQPPPSALLAVSPVSFPSRLSSVLPPP